MKKEEFNIVKNLNKEHYKKLEVLYDLKFISFIISFINLTEIFFFFKDNLFSSFLNFIFALFYLSFVFYELNLDVDNLNEIKIELKNKLIFRKKFFNFILIISFLQLLIKIFSLNFDTQIDELNLKIYFTILNFFLQIFKIFLIFFSLKTFERFYDAEYQLINNNI